MSPRSGRLAGGAGATTASILAVVRSRIGDGGLDASADALDRWGQGAIAAHADDLAALSELAQLERDPARFGGWLAEHLGAPGRRFRCDPGLDTCGQGARVATRGGASRHIGVDAPPAGVGCGRGEESLPCQPDALRRERDGGDRGSSVAIRGRDGRQAEAGGCCAVWATGGPDAARLADRAARTQPGGARAAEGAGGPRDPCGRPVQSPMRKRFRQRSESGSCGADMSTRWSK